MESDDLAVSVTNVNEPPVFPIASHSLEQEAGVKPPEPIVIMGATDPDEGDTLTYQIAGTHDKTNKVSVRPAKTQISLGIAQYDQSLHCPHEESLGP